MELLIVSVLLFLLFPIKINSLQYVKSSVRNATTTETVHKEVNLFQCLRMLLLMVPDNIIERKLNNFINFQH
jgi:hypothetical protein